MEPNEILPAIPRQKVIVTHNGKKRKYDFIGFVGDAEKPHAVYVLNYGGFIHEHPIENCEFCEPVPDEPRGFHCGDNVAYDYPDGTTEYTTVLAIRNVGDEQIIFTHGDIG